MNCKLIRFQPVEFLKGGPPSGKIDILGTVQHTSVVMLVTHRSYARVCLSACDENG